VLKIISMNNIESVSASALLISLEIGTQNTSSHVIN